MSSLLPPAQPGQLNDIRTPPSSGLLEEYKLLDQQARFVMTSYMQGLGLYLAHRRSHRGSYLRERQLGLTAGLLKIFYPYWK